MTRASFAAAVVPLLLAACAPRDAPEVQASPNDASLAPGHASAKASLQEPGLWLEVEGRVRKVAAVRGDGELVMTVPELRTSAPTFRKAGGRLEARALVVEGMTEISLTIDDQGYIHAEPSDVFGDEKPRVVGSELLVGTRRYKLEESGAISPPIFEAANLWLRSADALSAEQKWLLVAAELAVTRGGDPRFVVWGMGNAYGCGSDPNCQGL